jgi:hypothetical protein
MSTDEQQNELFEIHNIDRLIENLTYSLYQHENTSEYDIIKTEINDLTFTLAEKKCDYETRYNETLNLFAFIE